MYVKIFDSIRRSSIWDESPETRITWITLLTMADFSGLVVSTISGIAREANIPLDKVQEAITAFQNPDPASMTSDDDGRRLESVGPNRWLIINYKKYRQLATAEDEREAGRLRVQRHREKANSVNQLALPCNGDVTVGNGLVTVTEVEVEVEVDRTDSKESCRSGPTSSLKIQVHELFEFWKQIMGHPKATLNAKVAAKRVRKIELAVEAYGMERCKAAIVGCASSAYHMGDNPQGTKYDDIELILRDATKVERFEAMAANAEVTTDPLTGALKVSSKSGAANYLKTENLNKLIDAAGPNKTADGVPIWVGRPGGKVIDSK